MSNGGGAGGGSSFGGVQSAADAPDPNDVIAKLKAAPTQAAANFLKSMTLPLFAPVARSALRDPVRRQARLAFRAACVARNHTRAGHRRRRRWIDAIVPRLRVTPRKRRANRRERDAAVAKLSHRRETMGDSIRLKGAANLGGASRMPSATVGVPLI
jgi:hypothetical protein